nr:hypothetical protein [Tanacetum cinerariifolium]
MATEPNDVRRTTLRRLRQELVADVELANNLLHKLNRLTALERASFFDMTNSNNLVAVRTELLLTIADKEQMINHYKTM